MAKIAKETQEQAQLISFLYETILENINNKGRPILASQISVSNEFFNEENEQNAPMLRKLLGTINLKGQALDLWLCSEINSYNPGKIYVGIKVTNDPNLIQELRDRYKELLTQEPMGEWIYWRYITINGDVTVNTNSGAIPHFKIINDAFKQIASNEKMFNRFALTLIECWQKTEEIFSEIALELKA